MVVSCKGNAQSTRELIREHNSPPFPRCAPHVTLTTSSLRCVATLTCRRYYLATAGSAQHVTRELAPAFNGTAVGMRRDAAGSEQRKWMRDRWVQQCLVPTMRANSVANLAPRHSHSLTDQLSEKTSRRNTRFLAKGPKPEPELGGSFHFHPRLLAGYVVSAAVPVAGPPS